MSEITAKDSGGKSLAEGVRELYQEGQTDYSMTPLILVDKQKAALGRIQNGDAVVFCCRRGEREIQLTEAFTQADFPHFPRPNLNRLKFVILTMYHEKFKDLPIAFAPTQIKGTLAECLSAANRRQSHIAESEKFAHVTFFFNGGNNQPFSGEEDIRIPSPKGIPFDEVPELRLDQVADRVIEDLKKHTDFIVTNFANGDVIGHTANNAAKVKCAKIVDYHLGRVVDEAIQQEYLVLITADHGNLEEMVTPEGTPHVAHTANLVPLIVIHPDMNTLYQVTDGKLADLAPTILQVMGIKPSAEMTGDSLLVMPPVNTPAKVLLVILDGWGIGPANETNPIHLASTPIWDKLLSTYPNARLQAAGDAVGLKAGKAGNSEAGHINIGAGRIVLQDDVRLDLAMNDGSFSSNPVFTQVIDDTIQQGTNLHLIGLLTEKSSHGSIDYPLALLKMAKDHGLDRVYLHMILDGRSTEPGSAPGLLELLDQKVQEIGIGKIVSAIGRGIALDRDGNYEKTQKAFNSFVLGYGRQCSLK